MFRVIAVSTLCIWLAIALPSRAADDIDEGLAAYHRGDYVSAFRELLYLSEQGHALARFHIGYMYFKGLGVPQDNAEAVKWYLKAAKQGIGNAQFNLGFMYGSGWGVRRDDAEAFKWYLKAAEQGLKAAQYRVGLMFALGRGVAALCNRVVVVAVLP